MVPARLGARWVDTVAAARRARRTARWPARVWSRLVGSWRCRRCGGDRCGKNRLRMAVHLITGDDESLLRSAVSDLVHRLVGDGDRSLMVDDFDGDEYELRVGRRRRADAAVPHRHAGRRARGVGRFTADDVAPLVAYLAIRCQHRLVLVGGGGRLPKALTDAVKQAGGSRSTRRRRRRPKDRGVDRRAGRERGLAARPGGDDAVGRLARRGRRPADGMLDTLAVTYGTADGSRPPTSSRSSARPGACRRGISPTRSTPATPPGAGAAAPDDGRRRPPSAAGDGHPAQPLHAGCQARRRRRQRGRRRRGAGHQARLPGARRRSTSTGASAAAASSGRSSCSPRPTSTCAAPRTGPTTW